MSILVTFPAPPPEGYITVTEWNVELVALTKDEALNNKYTQNLQYPEVDISADSRHASLAVKESAKSAFLEQKDTPQVRLRRAWYEHGLTGVLEELASSGQSRDGGSEVLSTVCHSILGGVRWCSSLHGSLFPHLSMSSEDLIAEFSTNPQWKEGSVRQFTWHPHTTKFAIALKDDSIRVHMATKRDLVPLLKHKMQKGVADLAWSPNSASLLAVACQTCILIWNIDPTSLATRPSTSAVQTLRRAGHCPVTSIAWFPQGGALVSASPADTAILVWDVSTESCVPLRRVGGGGVSLLSWSPDGAKLLTACPSPIFRVWESCHWTCEKWSKLSDRCQAACWSPDGTLLLFATANEPIIYSLSFAHAPDESSSVIGGSKVAVSALDLSEVEIETEEDARITLGGLVQAMVWDPTGERLAVSFKGPSKGLIALLQTRLYPSFEVIPCGFIRGFPGEVPHIISFQPKFTAGALLSVVWSSGRLAHIPLNFIKRDVTEKGQLYRHM